MPPRKGGSATPKASQPSSAPKAAKKAAKKAGDAPGDLADTAPSTANQGTSKGRDGIDPSLILTGKRTRQPSSRQYEDDGKPSQGQDEPDLVEEPRPKKAKCRASVSAPGSGIHLDGPDGQRILPARVNRAIDPAGPDRPKTYLSHEEVEAEKERKQQMQLKLQQLENEKRLLLAEMQLANEDEDRRDAIAAGLDSVLVMEYADGDNDEALEMPYDDMGHAEEDAGTADEGLPVKKATTQATRKEKLKKGDLRSAIDGATKEMRGTRTAHKPIPSKSAVGLLPDWKRRVPKPPATSKAASKSTLKETAHQSSTGGLNDDDAYSDRPEARTTPKPRVNELILINSESESDHSTVSSPPPPVTPRSKKSKHGISRTREASQPVKPAHTSRQTSSRSVPRVEGASPTPISSSMPSVVAASWSTKFLPTLYHMLFCSNDPWGDFSGESLVNSLQQVLDIVHPGFRYRVQYRDAIYTKA
ncbi:hypothetical protein HGRIS_001444 [Hohenbuehelia grisea]|uniref:Uncharacterized protein n=1 Tax=Hohenbuehelia grisea TaxID=104357 RepID=A0ABR3JPB7_9AGAR